RQRPRQAAGLLSQRVMVSVPAFLHTPRFSLCSFRRQRAAHSKNWGRSNTGAKQSNPQTTRKKRKTARRSASLHYVAYMYVTMYIGTGYTVQLLLDTHTIVICAWSIRERVTAQQRWCIRMRPQTQDNELAWLGRN